MKLSIVATLYESSPYIRQFYLRISAAAKALVGDDFEIVWVNDGSPDNSLNLAEEIAAEDDKIVIVDLSRNFGHHKAIMCGLSYATGDYIYLTDVDLEEPPELLLDLWAESMATGAELVYGVQVERKGSWFERISGQLYYKIFNWLTETRIVPNALITKLMTKDFLIALLSHQERGIFLGGLIEITGFRQIPYTCVKGHKGTTTYTLRRRISQFVESICSFTVKPLYLLFYGGILVSLISVFLGLYIALNQLLFHSYMSGWPSLITLILFLAGIILSSIGLLGVYISKILVEVKQRPRTITRKVIKR